MDRGKRLTLYYFIFWLSLLLCPFSLAKHRVVSKPSTPYCYDIKWTFRQDQPPFLPMSTSSLWQNLQSQNISFSLYINDVLIPSYTTIVILSGSISTFKYHTIIPLSLGYKKGLRVRASIGQSINEAAEPSFPFPFSPCPLSSLR